MNANKENVVWTSTLDGKYEVTVTRTHGYQAELTISEGGQVLHHEAVGLSYGAIFGPDVADVAAADRRRVCRRTQVVIRSAGA